MAFSSDITVTDGTNSTVMSEIYRQASETLRRDAARGLVYPKTMRIAHQVVSASLGGKANRALIRLDDVQSTDASDPTKKAGDAVYLVLQHPESITNTTVILRLVKELTAFLTPTNVAKLLNGES